MATITMTEPSSSAIELQQFSGALSLKSQAPSFIAPGMHSQSGENLGSITLEDVRQDAMPPSQAVEALQRWNFPRINMWRVFATFWSFLIVGMNDGSYGALIPHLERYYDLSYTVVSLIFLSPFVGYSLASIFNNLMHVHFGQRGIALTGPLCHLVAYTVVAVHPPYPVLVVMFIFVGFGNGLIDAAWCAWIGNMANANEVSGFLQACYSLGATISPLIATAMVENGGLTWYTFYYIMIAGSVVELLTSSLSFWKQTGAVYQAENPREPGAKTGRTREALKSQLTWIFALFIFGYVGAEVSLGGWIITFMTNIRDATPIASSGVNTGYWAGMTVGRLCLGFVTARIGEWPATLIYLGLAAGLELIFWLVPNLYVSAIAVAFLGLVMGPMFPTAIVLVTKLLPKDLHVGTIGFATAFGGSGGAIFPFIVGAIAQARGVKMLQPVVLGLLGAITLLWFVIPKNPKRDHGSEIERVGSE